jgi:hypothetical protein
MSYGTTPAPAGLGIPRNSMLWMLMLAVIGFGVMVGRQHDKSAENGGSQMLTQQRGNRYPHLLFLFLY